MNPISSKARQPVATILFGPILIGMLTAQLIATGFVYLSNLRTLAMVTAVEKAGYAPIPAGAVAATLNEFGPAFWGGLFFTLSIGAVLPLATWAGIQLWDSLFRRNRWVLIIYFMLYTGLLTAVNLNGATLFPMLFCLLVPLPAAWVGLKGLPAPRNAGSLLWTVPVITLATLTALWATQMNQNLFTTIRDHILLSNPVGRGVNDFYYRYTLYAAEAFKSFEQKTLRSCHLEGIETAPATRWWQERLAQHDLLVLPELEKPDVRMVFNENRLRLICPQGRSYQTTPQKFLADPGKALHSFSRATDRFAPLRRLTLAGLLLGFPILLFTMVYGVVRTAAGWMLAPQKATVAAAALCMVTGILLFLPMLNARPITITADKIATALSADQWSHRVAALRYIEAHKLEITAYSSYRRLLHSPLVVERYWLARAMARSRAEETHKHLLTLMGDPHPNVTCQALFALGERGRREAVDPIKHQMAITNHWYTQWYGYGALRKLGWRQTR